MAARAQYSGGLRESAEWGDDVVDGTALPVGRAGLELAYPDDVEQFPHSFAHVLPCRAAGASQVPGRGRRALVPLRVDPYAPAAGRSGVQSDLRARTGLRDGRS